MGPPGERGDQGLQGIAGTAGAQGLTGAVGAPGLSGPAGPRGAAGPTGLSFQGVYSSTVNYGLADGVNYEGAGYVSLIAGNHGNTPDQSPAAWALFAAAGSAGAVGAVGAAGTTGPTGLQGATGLAGPVGPSGALGPQGPPVVNYLGNFGSATSYGMADAVSFGGSTYVSLTSSNHGNTPDQSPANWAVLAAKGDAGVAGVPGVAGPAGPAGLAGEAGAAGAQGPPVSFIGGWLTGREYAVGDAVSFAGGSYIALVANSGRQPDVSPVDWGILAQPGGVGPVGPAGATGFEGPTGFPGAAGATGAAGPVGPSGPPGLTGSAGPLGPTGVAGPQGAAGIAGLAFRGAYSPGINYGLNDGVVVGGSTYISLSGSNAGNSPAVSPGFWAVLAAAGAAGSNGSTGPAGVDGRDGAAGVMGPAGPQGLPGAAGAAGANGSAGLVWQGVYASTTNYALNDAVSYQGSSYISLGAGNRGNLPPANGASWALLASLGSAGGAGVQGPAGVAGATGPQGPAGAQGAAGSTGAVGINFRGGWVAGTGYGLNDTVTFGGATYLAQISNASVEPDTNASVWAVLASAGSAGPTGAAGPAVTIEVGTVVTGAPGSAATVVNSGSAAAAVLNFTIPQGAPGASGGGAGGGGTSGIPFASMYHAVSFSAVYYSVNNTNQAATETAAVLSWVPGGCTATSLTVFSEQAAIIQVTLRTGTPGAMSDSALSCSVATGKSCTAGASVAVAAGGFLDLGITHSDGNASGVWTAVMCN